jgi:FkbM family methyltransferase
MRLSEAHMLGVLLFAGLATADNPPVSSLVDRIKSEWREARGAHRVRMGRGRGRGVGRSTWRQAIKHGPKVCENTCDTANNGICEDGTDLIGNIAARGIIHVKCDYGTDCADCQAVPAPAPAVTLRHAMRSAPASPEPAALHAPVALLRKHNINVDVAWTRTQPPFIMPFTDPKADIDVSRAMVTRRSVEPLYNLYVHRLCAECCAKGGLMLDVGANFGYYSFLAAKLGCRVVAWEPVPAFRAFVQLALRLNNLTHRVHLRPAVISDVAGMNITMTVPLKGIWGTASVGGLNVDPSIPSPTYSVRAVTETLDQMVTETPCMMKLDVEGYEPNVIKGARRFLAKHAPAVILSEYTPGVMERARLWQRLPDYPASLRAMSDVGYRIWHLVGTSKNAESVLTAPWSTLPLPPLAEVTERSLKAEEVNAANMVSDNIGGRQACKRKFMRGACGGFGGGFGFRVPWDLHPLSLHAEFAHNTDILLTRGSDVVRRRREVGVSASTKFGLGGGMCEHVRRDGTPFEVIGRLCHNLDRNESIAKAIAIAEKPRPIRVRQSWGAHVLKDGKRWKLNGPLRSAHRMMVPKAQSR